MNDLLNVDTLSIYRNSDFVINDYITLHQPTLDEICDFGEQKYYEMIYLICSVGADLKWQLDDIGIDYTKIEDFDLFCQILSKSLDVSKTKILFGDVLDFSKMRLVFDKQINDLVLIQLLNEKEYIKIDRFVYLKIVKTIRTMHSLKRNDELPGNEATKKFLIDDARDEYNINKNKPYESKLMDMVSTMVNSEGFKHDENTVFNVRIYPFMNSVGRILKITNARILLQSGYSGFGIDLKKINKEEIDYIGTLN